MSLLVFEIQLTYNTISVPVTQHSDSIFLYISKWSPQCLLWCVSSYKDIISLSTISPYCTFHTYDPFISQLEVCTFNLPHVFTFSSHLSPLAASCLYSASIDSVSVVLHLFPHISEIIQYFSFLVWLISFRIITSRSTDAVTNCKTLFFFHGCCC